MKTGVSGAASLSSASVGRRFSANCNSENPPTTLTHWPGGVRATCAEYRAIELDLQHDEADRGRKLACPMLVLWGADTTKRPGWQTGWRLDMLATWRERAVEVQGRGLDCGHFLPEEKPDDVGRRAVQLRSELLGRYATFDDDGAVWDWRIARGVAT